MVRKVVIEAGINYVEVANEAAFYGVFAHGHHHRHPVRAGRAGTSPCPLVAVRKDFGLTYRDKDKSNKTPLCIHRAPLGTHERFIGFLIEHCAGNFPLWLAPDQVRVITLNDDEALIAYAQPIVAELRARTWCAWMRISAPRRSTPINIASGGEDCQCGTIARPHDAGHRRSRHGGRRGERASPPRRPARREAEGGGHGGHSGEHQRAKGVRKKPGLSILPAL